ncbi:serine hydrolase domain-containing protein [Streptomyces sp. SID13031]|uniref:serine hydrolase domain-containing protein n=1 Tax=Streptomyces sp. SID13031 TaxID=2706046 RepID=UPI0013CB3052|nr:serine hydrolase domain-containing protein [Streptomyces sp. SID13031]NEA36774.1 beta-lactamase family protein [Streptomyces sp. SID13031]
MGRSRVVLAVTVTVAMLLSGCSSGDTAAPPPSSTFTDQAGQKLPDPATTVLDPGKAAALQAVLTKVVSDPAIEAGSRGVTAAVVTDQWIWSGAAGKDAAGTALTPQTSMGVASITKTFVASEVMLLAQAKKIDLDAPLSQYVHHRLTANNATVRQHLSMRSGVPNYLPGDYAKMDIAIKAAPGKHWTPEQALSYDTAEPTQPDSPYNYSNPSYVLLGMLIEKVTGQPLATVLSRDLAKPAGLERAAFQDGQKPMAPVAEDRNPACGKAVDGYTPCRAIASLSAANAGLAADTPTIARWGYQLYGDRVVPGGLVQQMTSGDGDYGLGTMLFSQSYGLGTAYGHRGDMPDYTSLLVVIPDHKLSVAVILADGQKRPETVVTELITALQPLLG